MRMLFPALVAAGMMVFSPTASQARILVEVDKSAQQMVVTVDGQRRHVWPVSTGRLGHDTPEGNHRAFRLERDHFSREWDDAPMPHSIFFTKRGHAIHGSNDINRIGTPASAGCVRLAPENARTLFEMVEARGVLNTTVVITGDVNVALARTGRPVAGAQQPRRQQAARTQRQSVDAYASRMRDQYYRERPSGYYREPYYAPPSYYVDRYQRPYQERRYVPYRGWN